MFTRFKICHFHNDKLYLTIALVSATLLIAQINAADERPLRPWLKSQRASGTPPQQQQQQQPSQSQQSQPQPSSSTGTAVEITGSSAISAPLNTLASSVNRTTRTTDIFQSGDGYNIFVTNTCERESMKVNIKTSRPFYGVIHTKNQRAKAICTVEGNGDTDYNLEISHILNSQDPNYCGVIRARRDSPEDKDLLSVVVAVRVHRSILRSDDKFFLLNCTNRCRKPDCSEPTPRLFDPDDSTRSNNIPSNRSGRLRENEGSPAAGEREPINVDNPDECTIWKFPWAITLIWVLGILLLASLISHCIMCSSLVCRCVKTEVEEQEPSIYEGATDYEDDLYNKRHPHRIDYDNRDIYKTTNNYAPYNLEEAQTKSRHKHKRGSR